METLAIKLIILFSVLLGTVICALLPFKLISGAKSKRGYLSTRQAWITEVLNCFAGGVFLATTLLDLLPEVREGFEAIYDHYGASVSYPFPELTISVGFFLIIIIEHIILKLLQASHTEKMVVNPDVKDSSVDGYVGHTIEDSQVQEIEESAKSNFNNTEKENGHLDSETTPLLESTKSPQAKVCDAPQIHSVRSFVLLLALSVHTIFEGLALGLMKTEASLWNLFAGVFIHKVVVAFSLGTQFAENISHRCRAIFFMLLFSLMSPIGIIIGLSITETKSDSFGTDMASTLLQALAAGTFLHVTFFEVLAKEISTQKSFLKILVILLGYACIAVVTIFSE